LATLEVENLTYTYPGQSTPALQNISIQAEGGQLIAIIGPNGAGKSTLCLALAGMIPSLYNGQMQGVVRVNGIDTRQHTTGQLAGKVGLVLQNPANQLSHMRYTVYEEVAFGLENLGIPRSDMPARIEFALEQVGLSDLRDRSPYTLSGGQQQRLALASILVMHPPVLVLDEPTAMLDPGGGQEVFEILRQLVLAGSTVILAEHRLEWIARYASQVIALEQGKMILMGSPEEVMTSLHLLQNGTGWLRYTQAAQTGLAQKLWPPEQPLPVTLEQAVDGFQQIDLSRRRQGQNRENPA
jgi:energy-coupling factor transporter ATP-binding protein EcfA2